MAATSLPRSIGLSDRASTVTLGVGKMMKESRRGHRRHDDNEAAWTAANRVGRGGAVAWRFVVVEGSDTVCIIIMCDR